MMRPNQPTQTRAPIIVTGAASIFSKAVQTDSDP